ncbi:MAG: ABC transporter ATP-binding protein [Alicyclobacillus sp.]|nr:ABC transporter ATP-binding protein [Alicyclobacillus sp.]
MGQGEVLCLVGESGCGKSTVGKMVADVIEPSDGVIFLHNRDLSTLTKDERNQASLRIQIIHQDPFAALNPTRTIYQTLSAPLKIHGIARSRADIQERLSTLLSAVGLTPPEEFLRKYPHQLSGGQRQRIVIARALTVNPSVLVADEATSMVDVSLRVGILKTLQELSRSLHVATLFITHDFAVARYFGYGQKLAVMYLGEFVEVGVTEDVISRPQHPYTKMLLSAVPLPDPVKNRTRQRILPSSDEIPDAANIPPGCSFANRCPFATDICRVERPLLRPSKVTGQQVACHHAD